MEATTSSVRRVRGCLTFSVEASPRSLLRTRIPTLKPAPTIRIVLPIATGQRANQRSQRKPTPEAKEAKDKEEEKKKNPLKKIFGIFWRQEEGLRQAQTGRRTKPE